LDSEICKKVLDLSDFNDNEDRAIAILALILLKNINNLTLELGTKGVQLFIQDITREYFERQENLKRLKPSVENILMKFLQRD